MKILFLSMLLTLSLMGDSNESDQTMSCYEIQQKIDKLESEKTANTSGKIATFFAGGGYVYGSSNDTLNTQIKLLKYNLSECK